MKKKQKIVIKPEGKNPVLRYCSQVEGIVKGYVKGYVFSQYTNWILLAQDTDELKPPVKTSVNLLAAWSAKTSCRVKKEFPVDSARCH